MHSAGHGVCMRWSHRRSSNVSRRNTVIEEPEGPTQSNRWQHVAIQSEPPILSPGGPSARPSITFALPCECRAIHSCYTRARVEACDLHPLL
eukprot:365821-Chlamydomonas_euryale.AAC.5